MKVFSVLADQAQIDPQAKVHALGINWTTMSSPTAPMAVIVVAEIPAEETPAALSMAINLLNSNDEPVEIPSPPDGQLKPLSVTGVGTAARTDFGREAWEPVRVPFVAQIGPGLPMPPGDYRFAITVSQAGGETVSDELRFHVRKTGE